MKFAIGDVYRTSMATWTVEYISTDGMIRFHREDGRTAWFSAKMFATWVIEKLVIENL